MDFGTRFMLPYSMMDTGKRQLQIFRRVRGVKVWAVGIFCSFILAACFRVDLTPLVEPDVDQPLMPSPVVPTTTSILTIPASPTLTPSPTHTPIPEASDFQICSPLAGVEPSKLNEAVSNPFFPPAPGSDAPHHGVDLAHYGQNQVALPGLPVLAVMDGRVAGVISDRFPYGNAVILETPLDDLPEELLIFLPDIDPLPTITASLTCPSERVEMDWDLDSRSLYLLYAHLQQEPDFQPGEEVRCGDVIGAIGDSGNALNPHLHLEMRVGPSGAHIPSMSHYHPGAATHEMSAYCTWRISGYFQMFDPMIMFSYSEE
jgi:hypothetical protein